MSQTTNGCKLNKETIFDAYNICELCNSVIYVNTGKFMIIIEVFKIVIFILLG